MLERNVPNLPFPCKPLSSEPVKVQLWVTSRPTTLILALWPKTKSAASGSAHKPTADTIGIIHLRVPSSRSRDILEVHQQCVFSAGASGFRGIPPPKKLASAANSRALLQYLE